MTKSTITREQLEEWVVQFEEDGGCDATDRQLEALIRQSLAAMNNEPVAFTEKHEISNMHATGLYLRAWPADRARNSVEGYTIPLYTTPQPISLVNSEPVAYIFKHPAGRLFWALTDESNKGHDDVMPVYAAPQPAPVVPEEKPIPNTLSMYAVDAVAAIAEVKGWNACRAAMLQELKKNAGTEAICRSDENVQVLHTKSPAQSDCCPAQNQGWIPVSERMPEDRISVILWDAEIGEVTSGHYSHKTQTFYHCGDAIENEITHWMPPPCAPQEVK
ncbi:DUF551 domain-containing protein [Klebsiella pneumoniae]|uniref:DUF551 domain-containing protein n=1 Tax=Klebsiella pneumoniae TaxID=573 RepID=UPI003DA3073B